MDFVDQKVSLCYVHLFQLKALRKVILVLFDFAQIYYDEAEMSRNRFYFCRCVVAINAKVIFRFELTTRKRSFH